VLDKSKKENPQIKAHKSFTKKKWLISGLIVVIVVLVVATLGYLLISRLINTAKDDSNTRKVLTVNDLENPDVELVSDTSNASVDNLTKELKAQIDKQIAAKQNPNETVKKLAGVLSNTTNDKRQDQLTSFVEDFLANHENALWFNTEFVTPDQAQVNYWKAGLYADLVYNYQFIMLNKFTGSDGKPIDTTKEQIKYIDLYLTLANDPASHPPIPEKDKDIFVGYVYKEATYFLELKSKLSSGETAQ
jgi:hypothetical protein